MVESMSSQLGNWEVAEGVLGLRAADGSRHVPTAEDIYAAAFESELRLRNPAKELVDLRFSRTALTLELRVEPSEESATGLTTSVAAVGNGVSKPLREFSQSAADHLIVDGSWYPFAKGALPELLDLIERQRIALGSDLHLKQYFDLLRLSAEHPSIRDLSMGNAAASKRKAQSDFAVPKGFRGELYSYQRDGWKWLQLIAEEKLGGILADEMGLGKTVQIAVLIAAQIESGEVPCLIVAPGTLLENWRRELDKFVPAARVHIHRGPGRTGVPRDLAKADVVVTSYDTVVRDISLLRGVKWHSVVLDEAQAIKNPETRRASAVKRIPRQIGIAVTGTPLENRLRDVWSLSDFALPGLLGTLEHFNRTFADSEEGALAVEPRVSPIILRRRIDQVGSDLPPRIDVPQALELTEQQAQEYEQIRQEIIDQYGANAGLVAIGKLRMYCTHPSLLRRSVVDPCEESPKYERLVEILEEILESREKVIIFTSFNAMTDLLVNDLSARFGVQTSFIDGRVAIEERQDVVDQFGVIKGSSILVLNPRAAGVGLNITAANHVIHYNLEWNPAVEDQASARAHRRGQTRPVTVHRLFYINTVDETIDIRLQLKRALAETAIIGTDGTEPSFPNIAAALAMSPVRRR